MQIIPENPIQSARMNPRSVKSDSLSVQIGIYRNLKD